jgi:hypothetical protein
LSLFILACFRVVLAPNIVVLALFLVSLARFRVSLAGFLVVLVLKKSKKKLVPRGTESGELAVCICVSDKSGNRPHRLDFGWLGAGIGTDSATASFEAVTPYYK